MQNPRGLRNPFQSYELQMISIHYPSSEAVLLPEGFRGGTLYFLLQRKWDEIMVLGDLGRRWGTYPGEPLHAFCEFSRELGPVDVHRWVTVV